MKKLIRIIFLSLIFLILSVACSESLLDYPTDNYATGTVRFISLEGGFYGILTDDAKHFDPINLTKEFQVDGKRIFFRFVEKKDMASFHMWGTIVELFNVRAL